MIKGNKSSNFSTFLTLDNVSESLSKLTPTTMYFKYLWSVIGKRIVVTISPKLEIEGSQAHDSMILSIQALHKQARLSNQISSLQWHKTLGVLVGFLLSG